MKEVCCDCGKDMVEKEGDEELVSHGICKDCEEVERYFMDNEFLDKAAQSTKLTVCKTISAFHLDADAALTIYGMGFIHGNIEGSRETRKAYREALA